VNTLPEPNARQPHATTAGQPTTHQVDQLWNDYDRAILDGRPLVIPTHYKDDSEVPKIGTTPPVPQPGRPPMSQRATDTSALMLSGSVLTATLTGGATAILWASGHADPTVIGIIAATPAALAIPVLALSRLVKRVKETVEAAPPVINQTYTGTVIQDTSTTTTHTRGIWASTRNELPR
jgi:hypothetical protein